jgi:hypothetical protein
MTRTVALVLMSLCAANAFGQRPDFSGRWTLDSSIMLGGGRGDAFGNASGGGGGAGGGTGLGRPADALTVFQDDSMLVVQEIGDSTLAVTYRFGGKSTENVLVLGRGSTAKATFRSRWEDDGRLVTAIARIIPAQRARTVRLEYRESRWLAADGSMIVETKMVGRPAGRRAFYRKSQ